MDRQRLMFGIAVVCGVAGLALVNDSSSIFGSGDFHERYFGAIKSIGFGFLIAGGVCAAACLALKKR